MAGTLMRFHDFFRKATLQAPYPYQVAFATRPDLPHLLRAPTGAGKTAAAVLGWLWRLAHSEHPTPRRLAYCLPMRVLVEQSEKEAVGWVDKLAADGALGRAARVKVHVLMGGVEAEQWYLHPDRPAVLVGTQDMLLSRALNRGYAAGPAHWPVDFGQLNNDCLWVYDEPQLMGSGLSTSAQLAGLRAKLGTFGGCPSVWMSATLEEGWLATVDHREALAPHLLTDADYETGELRKRMTAQKTVARLGVPSSKEMTDVAKEVVTNHVPGTQSLVVVNTVERAKAAYEALVKLRNKSPTPELLLVHSRFRPRERSKLNTALQEKNPGDRIVVATQVVEAGVDISARTLVTELAPWPSVVQRAGRCNRFGEQVDGGKVFWIDVDAEKEAAPYSADDLTAAAKRLDGLEGQDVSPQALARLRLSATYPHTHVVRRRDVVDLFDTTPDLSGNAIDVGRYVRGDDPDTDVQVFWRAFTGEPSDEEPAARRDELCNVPVGKFRDFVKALAGRNKGRPFAWDHIDGEWRVLLERDIRPGITVMLPAAAGGYSALGWDAGSTIAVDPVPDDEPMPVEADQPEGTGDDWPSAGVGQALTVAQHTDNVCKELDVILGGVGVDLGEWVEYLKQAARWHDAGKGHEAFQDGMHRANPDLDKGQHWAKSGKKGRLTHGRRFFRHELASALAAWQSGQPFEVAYLVASHHGKVRLAIRSLPDERLVKASAAVLNGKVRLAIRSLPGEDEPGEADRPFAVGVHDGDKLPEVILGDEIRSPALELDLSPMRLGGDRSWAAHALRLRDAVGPFKLAYLEALLVAADRRASAAEKGKK